MLTAIVAATVGVGVLAMLMVIALKRDPRRARAGDARDSGETGWMHSPGVYDSAGDSCEGGDSGGSDGGGCGGDGGGGGGD